MSKKYKFIGCKVLMREMYRLAYASENIVDIAWKKQALHNTPDLLRSEVQAAIDATEQEEEQYDAILLGYCLCSNGIVGLKSSKTPLVIARGHDCITLLLGSKERYQKVFDSHNGGIYWYSPGWIEHSLQPGKDRYGRIYQEYLEKYGEDNAEYLMEMEQGWMREYKHAIYIEWPEDSNSQYRRYTQECADFLNWECHYEPGSSALLQSMIDGDWDEEKFLVVQPGETVQPSFNDAIIKATHAG